MPKVVTFILCMYVLSLSEINDSIVFLFVFFFPKKAEVILAGMGCSISRPDQCLLLSSLYTIVLRDATDRETRWKVRGILLCCFLQFPVNYLQTKRSTKRIQIKGKHCELKFALEVQEKLANRCPSSPAVDPAPSEMPPGVFRQLWSSARNRKRCPQEVTWEG